jgi:hypothetical protein
MTTPAQTSKESAGSSNESSTVVVSTLGTSTPASSICANLEQQSPLAAPADIPDSENGCRVQKFKPPTGWLNKPPFYNNPPIKIKDPKKWIYESELTWLEKLAIRKAAMKEYFQEALKCLPHAKRLLYMIIRISPFRMVALILLNIMNGLVPALGLQTRGQFIFLV